MKRLIVFIPLCLCLSIPSHALTFFRTDYDGDIYRSETAYSGDWLPLRELSEILPYEVEWKDRTVYVYADRTWEIKPDRWMPEGVKIEDGVTYVTPDYMRRFLPGISFLFEDELAWSIVHQTEVAVYQTDESGNPVLDETGAPIQIGTKMQENEYDNSEYCVAGPITDNRDGTISVKMGKPTQLEMMQAQLANAVTQAELETAYTEGVNSL